MCWDDKCCWLDLILATIIYSIIEIVCTLGYAFLFGVVTIAIATDQSEENEFGDFSIESAGFIMGAAVLALSMAVVLLVGAKTENSVLVTVYYIFALVFSVLSFVGSFAFYALLQSFPGSILFGWTVWYLFFALVLIRRTLNVM